MARLRARGGFTISRARRFVPPLWPPCIGSRAPSLPTASDVSPVSVPEPNALQRNTCGGSVARMKNPTHSGGIADATPTAPMPEPERTPCCNATLTGTDDGPACRNCYEYVSPSEMLTDATPTCDTCGIGCDQWQPHPDGFECLVCDDVLNDDGSVLYSAEDGTTA